MRVSFHLCLLAVIAMALADDASNSTEPAAPTQDPSTPYPGFGDMSGAMGAIASIQMQQQWSQKYGNLILDFQSNTAWMQIAQGYLQMLEMEGGVSRMLEEEDDEEDNGLNKLGTNYDDLERSVETQFMYVLKMFYIQSGIRFHAAHQSHYQTKIQLAVLQQIGAGNPAISSVLYLMYYMEMLRLMGSSVTIQRHDALTHWLYHEMMETDEFDNSRVALPVTFEETMVKSRVVATQLHVQQASIDYQILMLEYYLQMLTGSLASGHYSNNAAASSFLEEEMTAEPNKPFFSPMMMMGPQYLNYFVLYLKFASSTFNLQCAQAFALGAQIDSNPSDANAKHAVEIKRNALHALYQWAYINLQLAMVQMWGMFSGAPVAHNAAASSLVQTDAQVAPTA